MRVAENVEQAYESPARPDEDQRVVVYGVDWATYESLRERLDRPGLRMTYREGTLELMTPSRSHEDYKKRIARLLELWALEKDVPLKGYGQTTFKKEAAASGLEPDECYVLGGELADTPDLAIEVVLRSGGLNKLDVYAGLGIREVWFWIDGGLQIRVLTEGRYEPRARSALLPTLDLEELARFARETDQHAALKAYRAALARST